MDKVFKKIYTVVIPDPVCHPELDSCLDGKAGRIQTYERLTSFSLDPGFRQDDKINLSIYLLFGICDLSFETYATL